MGLGDGLRALAMQHLAQGGSADELHDELSALTPPSMLQPNSTTFGPVNADGSRMGPSGTLTQFADPGYALAGLPQKLAEHQTMKPAQSIAFAPGADGIPATAPAAPPLPQSGAPAAPPLGTTAPGVGDFGHIAMSGPLGGPNPYNPAMNRALGASDAAEQGSLAATDAYGRALDAEGQGKAEELRIRGLQSAAEQPIRDEQALEATQHAERTQALQAQFQQRIDVQMGKYQAASDEAAQAQVHNFFENKSTGASIMAIVSQALAGAANGLSGNPGAPTPLDRIIADDMDRQKTNIELKGRNADRQGNMLRTLRDELGSQTLAENAYYSAALDKTEAMIKTLAPHYAGGINSAQAQQALAAVQQKKEAAMAQAQQHVAATETQKGDALSHASEAYENRRLSLAFAANKQKGKEQQDFQTRGFNGTIPKASKDTADKLQSNHYGIQSALSNYDEVLNLPFSEANYNKLKAADSAVSLAIHNAGFTRPAQLDDMIAKMTPGTKTAATNWLDAKGRLHEVRKDYADLYRQGMLGLNPYKASNPDGLVADYSDPVMGGLWNERDGERAQRTQIAGGQ